MLWIGETDWHIMQPVVIVENDVIISNALPDWGRVCIASDVRGGPDEMYATRYSVSVGQTVRLHDLSQPVGAWVSIGAAEWMPLKNICDWNGE